MLLEESLDTSVNRRDTSWWIMYTFQRVMCIYTIPLDPHQSPWLSVPPPTWPYLRMALGSLKPRSLNPNPNLLNQIFQGWALGSQRLTAPEANLKSQSVQHSSVDASWEPSPQTTSQPCRINSSLWSQMSKSHPLTSFELRKWFRLRNMLVISFTKGNNVVKVSTSRIQELCHWLS